MRLALFVCALAGPAAANFFTTVTAAATTSKAADRVCNGKKDDDLCGSIVQSFGCATALVGSITVGNRCPAHCGCTGTQTSTATSSATSTVTTTPVLTATTSGSSTGTSTASASLSSTATSELTSTAASTASTSATSSATTSQTTSATSTVILRCDGKEDPAFCTKVLLVGRCKGIALGFNVTKTCPAMCTGCPVTTFTSTATTSRSSTATTSQTSTGTSSASASATSTGTTTATSHLVCHGRADASDCRKFVLAAGCSETVFGVKVSEKCPVTCDACPVTQTSTLTSTASSTASASPTATATTSASTTATSSASTSASATATTPAPSARLGCFKSSASSFLLAVPANYRITCAEHAKLLAKAFGGAPCHSSTGGLLACRGARFLGGGASNTSAKVCAQLRPLLMAATGVGDLGCTKDGTIAFSGAQACATAARQLTYFAEAVRVGEDPSVQGCATTATSTATTTMTATETSVQQCFGKVDEAACGQLDCGKVLQISQTLTIDPFLVCPIKCDSCPVACNGIPDDGNCVRLEPFCGKAIPGTTGTNVTEKCPGTCKNCPKLPGPNFKFARIPNLKELIVTVPKESVMSCKDHAKHVQKALSAAPCGVKFKTPITCVTLKDQQTLTIGAFRIADAATCSRAATTLAKLSGVAFACDKNGFVRPPTGAAASRRAHETLSGVLMNGFKKTPLDTSECLTTTATSTLTSTGTTTATVTRSASATSTGTSTATTSLTVSATTTATTKVPECNGRLDPKSCARFERRHCAIAALPFKIVAICPVLCRSCDYTTATSSLTSTATTSQSTTATTTRSSTATTSISSTVSASESSTATTSATSTATSTASSTASASALSTATTTATTTNTIGLCNGVPDHPKCMPLASLGFKCNEKPFGFDIAGECPVRCERCPSSTITTSATTTQTTTQTSSASTTAATTLTTTATSTRSATETTTFKTKYGCAKAADGKTNLLAIADAGNCGAVAGLTSSVVAASCKTIVKSDPGLSCLATGSTLKLLGVKKDACPSAARALRNLANAVSGGARVEFRCVENVFAFASQDDCEQATDDLNGVLQYHSYNRTDMLASLGRCEDPTTPTSTATTTATSRVVDAALDCKRQNNSVGDGIFVTPNSNKVCTCRFCLDSEYTARACGPTTNTDCRRCTECAIGSYQTRACNSTTNSECKVCEKCASGTYLGALCQGTAPTVCKKCGANCQACAGAGDTCTVCNTGFSLSRGKCVSACNPGEFALKSSDGSRSTCTACHATCKECTGAKQDACSSCRAPGADAKFLNDLKVCSDRKCKGATFSYNATTCDKCAPSCATCYGPLASQCTTCAPGAALDDRGKCVAACPAGKHASKSGVCADCSPKCSTCTSASACVQCADGYELEGGQCFGLTVKSATAALKGKNTQVRYNTTNTRAPETCSPIARTTHLDIASDDFVACQEHARVLNQMVALCSARRAGVAAPFSCARVGQHPLAQKLQLQLSSCKDAAPALNKILRDLEPRPRANYQPLACEDFGSTKVLAYSAEKSELQCGAVAANVNAAIGKFKRGEYLECGAGFTTLTTTASATATSTPVATATTTPSQTAVTTPTSTVTTRGTCNGVADHTDCDALPLAQCAESENVTGVDVARLCPVKCGSCVATTPPVYLCNGAEDPLQCSTTFKGKCDTLFAGNDINQLCPAMCGTCPRTTVPATTVAATTAIPTTQAARWQCATVLSVAVPTMAGSECTAHASALNKIVGLCQANMPPIACSRGATGRFSLQVKAVDQCAQVATSLSAGMSGVGRALTVECVSDGRLGVAATACADATAALDGAVELIGVTGDTYTCDATALANSDTATFFFVRDPAYRAVVESLDFQEAAFKTAVAAAVAADLAVAPAQVEVESFNGATGAVALKISAADVAPLSDKLSASVDAGFSLVYDGNTLLSSATAAAPAATTMAAVAAEESEPSIVVPVLIAAVALMCILITFFALRQSRRKSEAEIESKTANAMPKDMFDKPVGGVNDSQLDSGYLDQSHTLLRKSELVNDLRSLSMRQASGKDLNEGLYAAKDTPADADGYLDVQEFEETANAVATALPAVGSVRTPGTATYELASPLGVVQPKPEGNYIEVSGAAVSEGTPTCAYESVRGNCKRRALPGVGSVYCQNHTCGMMGCMEARSSQNDYCKTHMQDSAALTPSQMAGAAGNATPLKDLAFQGDDVNAVTPEDDGDDVYGRARGASFSATTSFGSPENGGAASFAPALSPSAEVAEPQDNTAATAAAASDDEGSRGYRQYSIKGYQMPAKRGSDIGISPRGTSTANDEPEVEDAEPVAEPRRQSQQFWQSQFANRKNMFA